MDIESSGQLDRYENVAPVFQQFLREQRDELNRRFIAQAHLASGIDHAAFLEHLALAVSPIVESVASVLPECVNGVGNELFDLSLELFATGTIGPGAATPEIARVWKDVLPTIPRLVARDASVVTGALTNAVFNVARTQGARADDWLAAILVVAKQCDTVSRLLTCGQILAWRSGLVQYRSHAIESARELPLLLANIAFGLPAETSEAQLHDTIDHLHASPWNDVESATGQSKTDQAKSPSIRIVRSIGDFRGFGGLFIRPPVVSLLAEDLVVTDGVSTWRLLADCYGSLLQKIGGADIFPKADRSGKTLRGRQLKIDKNGSITWNGSTAKLRDLAGPASIAATSSTLAVSLGNSHRIVLIAA